MKSTLKKLKQTRKNKKKKENVLVDCTHIHELLAKNFYKVNLAKKINIQFESYYSSSESEVK